MLDDENSITRIKNYVNDFNSANQDLEKWVTELVEEVKYQSFGEPPCVSFLQVEEEEEISGEFIDAILVKSVKIGHNVQIDIYVSNF